MLLHRNELGWRLHKRIYGFTVKQPHVPLRSRIPQVGPVLLNILLVIILWLLKRDTKSMQPALYVIPLTLLMGAYCFRPGVLYIRPRRRILGDMAGPVPFSCVCIQLDQDQETGLYQVYLKAVADGGETTADHVAWRRLVWESNTEAEAVSIAGEFHAWGIGTPDPIVLAVKGDRRLRLLAYGGHILSFIALIAFVMRTAHRSGGKLIEAEPEVVLRAAQIIIAFVFLSVLPLAVYLCRLGRGAARCRRWPPPRMRIVSNMPLIEGDRAVVRGRRMAVVGFVLIMIGLIGGLYVPYKLGKIYGEQLRPTTPAASSRK